MKLIPLLLLSACLRVPHVPSAQRSPDQKSFAAVTVESECTSTFGDNVVNWYPDRRGAGVIISQRYVLTAAHVVSCPTLTEVHITLVDGRRRRMVVERDDAMFGAGRDIARLDLASAELLDLAIAPPYLSDPNRGHEVGWPGEIALPSGVIYGTFASARLMEATTHPGDSGAGIYDVYGRLVGLVVGGDGTYTSFVRVDADWLEGT